MEKKQKCKYCNKKKPLDNFPSAGIIKGKEYRRLKCQTCYQKAKREKANEKRRWIVAFKKTQQCCVCKNRDFRVLGFHHRDPSQKEVNISEATSWSLSRIKSEIRKCDMICSNCHLILHWEERNGA